MQKKQEYLQPWVKSNSNMSNGSTWDHQGTIQFQAIPV